MITIPEDMRVRLAGKDIHFEYRGYTATVNVGAAIRDSMTWDLFFGVFVEPAMCQLVDAARRGDWRKES